MKWLEQQVLADLGSTHLEHLANGVEEPTVRVDLLLILFLQTENDLYRDNATIGTLDFHGGGNRNCKDLVKSQTK